jgi:phosphatidate cytidylyltransferase
VLRHRLATAAVAIPTLLALILWAPVWGFALFVGTIAVLGVAEYMQMVFDEQPRDRRAFAFLGAVAVAGWASRGLGLYDQPLLDQELSHAGLALLAAGGLVWVLLARRDFEAGLLDLGRALVGVLYAGFLVLHFIWLQLLPHGPYWVIFVVLTGMAGDSAGYFVGHAFGRRRLAPRVSPGKTIEGALGILGGNLLSGVAAKWLLLPQLGWAEALLLAAAQGTLGQLGDLCESVMKRTYGAKDSGTFFPGHGGILDRIDSLVFPVAGVYYYVALCSS